MAKQRTAHQIIKELMDKGYCLRQLHEWSGLSTSTIHAMYNDEFYAESAETRDLLNSSKPTEKPRWADRIKRDKAK